MKKSILIFILICITMVSTSCTIAPNAPSDGIWYNEELMLVIEFGKGKTAVYSYDENLSSLDLQVRDWIDGGFDIIWGNGEGEIIDIYTGWKKHTSDSEFIILVYGKANPNDNFQTQIEINKKYTFVKIQNYDEISELKVN